MKAAAAALLEMRVSEVAGLLGETRQRVAAWCPGAKAARAQWLAEQWRSALATAQAAERARIKAEHSKKWTAYLLEELNQRCAERLGKKLTAADERRLVALLNAAASPGFRREPGVPAEALSRAFRRNAS